MTEVASLRERKKEQTRVDLIHTALRLFRERGYESTTVDDIVEAANYSRSTFFRYFGSKEDVVFGDITDRMKILPEQLGESLGDGDPWAMARVIVAKAIPDIVEHGAHLDECMRLWFSEPALHRRYAEINLQCERMFSGYFGSAWGVDPEQSVECQVAAAAIIGVARAAMGIYGTDRDTVAAALERGFQLLEKDARLFSSVNGAANGSIRRP